LLQTRAIRVQVLCTHLNVLIHKFIFYNLFTEESVIPQEVYQHVKII